MSLTMQAIVCDDAGDASVMHCAAVPMPEPYSTDTMPAQVRIRVRAAGINRPDVLQRAGLYKPPSDASPILGLEVAGEVVEVLGECEWRVGDTVCALTHGGGYAEYVWTDARHCLPIPDGWTMVQAAGLPETFFTVWLNVFEKAMLGGDGQQKTETLLVHAGASGIGLTAVQLAKALGQKVIVTLRNMDKAEQCRAFGAGAVVELVDGWDDAVLAHTDGRGVNVILDMLGASTASANVRVLARGGRIAWIAFLTGAKIELKVPDIMAKEAWLTGAFLRPQTAALKGQMAQAIRNQVLPRIAAGAIRPMVDCVFPMSEVQAAHAYMENSRHSGKIILQW